MIFRLYALYDKHEMINTGNQTREKSQVLSLVLGVFCRLCMSASVPMGIKMITSKSFFWAEI